MAVDNDLTMIARAKARGYLLLPSLPTPVLPGTGFNTALADTPTTNPFIASQFPFDRDALEKEKFVFRRFDNGCGTFLALSTSSSRYSSEHISLAFSGSVGNVILGGSVTGSYDKTVMQDKSRSKMSRKTTVQAGAVQFKRPPPLSSEARKLVQSGIDVFTKQYGDFYVNGFTFGGDAAVLVSQAVSKSLSKEKLKVQLKAQLLIFSGTTTIEDMDTISATESAEFGVVAFDSLNRSFVDCRADQGSALKLPEAQGLAADYASRVNNMSARVEMRMKALEDILEERTFLDWDDMRFLCKSDVVSRLVLVPYTTHREVMELIV